MFQKIHRRDLILLSGIFSLACFSMVVVMLLILKNQPGSINSAVNSSGQNGIAGPEPTHTVTYVEISGLSRYPTAETAARTWAQDAQLVSATANWPRVTRLEQVGEPAAWNFRFYSPAKERLFIVTVEPDGRVVTIEHPIPVTLPPNVIATDSWVIDSPAALAIWLDYGGHELLRTNPGLELLVQLRRGKQHANPVWTVLGLDSRTEDALLVMIDANEGVVVSREP